MKISNAFVHLVALPLAFAVACPAYSQNQTSPVLTETVVTATRTEQPLTDLVADVTVIDRETIERSGAVALADVLVRVPGIEFVRNGGPGTNTSIYLRGAETRFTAVYIDGVRVDSQSTGGATWEAIPLGQVDRIEVLRGPAGAVYGSDAMGGVIQIFTRKGDGPFAPFAGFGLGTYGTQKYDAGFSGSSGALDYSLGLARQTSTGFNARPIAGQNPDLDGYNSESINTRLGYQLNKAHRLEATALSNDLNSQYDASLNKDDRTLHTLQVLGLNWKAKWSDFYSTKLSVSDTRVRYETTPSPYLSITHLNGYLFQNEFRQGAHLVTAALERKVDQLENGAINRDRSQDALALGYGWTSRQHTVQLNVRHDQDSEFGGQDTGSAAYAYALTPQWRASASLGTAFRAPTLFQRFSVYGVSTLQPESSRNQELGLRYASGAGSLGVVAYRSEVTNLITFSTPGPCASGTGCYANTAQAEYSGVTFSASHRMNNINLQASLDLQDPRDAITGKQLTRRARQHAYVSADTRAGAWSVGAGLQLSGERFDNAANTTVLAGYSVLNLHASTRVNKDWTLLARVDNLADTSYQLASGYATPGRSFYLGAKWAPQP
jgi:vitamin B12 transporter